MKDKICYIDSENKKYPLVFNINVMEEIQEKYGSIDKWGEAVQPEGEEPNIKTLKEGLLIMMNEAIDILNEENNENTEPMESKKLGRILSNYGMQNVIQSIKSITVESTKSDEETKNA